VIETKIKLVNGDDFDISGLSQSELKRLHYEQEIAFANLIKRTEPFSNERRELMHTAFDTVSKIFRYSRHQRGIVVRAFSGTTIHHAKFVKKIVQNVIQKKGKCLYFEAGVGTGIVFNEISQIPNITAVGCEVYIDRNYISSDSNVIDLPMHLALERLSDDSIDVFYWCAVMEHIPEDEIKETIKIMTKKIATGGILINITPNKHYGPTDGTSLFEPVGSTPRGFHFREYSFSEMIEFYKHFGYQSCIGFMGVLRRGLYFTGNVKLIDPIKILIEKIAIKMPVFLRSRLARYNGGNTSIFKKL
jgi:hypothetical protein